MCEFRLFDEKAILFRSSALILTSDTNEFISLGLNFMSDDFKLALSHTNKPSPANC